MIHLSQARSSIIFEHDGDSLAVLYWGKKLGAIDETIDTEKALLAPERITKIAQYILEHFDQKTRRNDTYTLKNKRVSGFNSLMATASIEAAKRYYATFKELQKDKPEEARLKIGIIYSYAPNEDEVDGLLPDEEFEARNLDASSRDFLEVAIKDYIAAHPVVIQAAAPTPTPTPTPTNKPMAQTRPLVSTQPPSPTKESIKTLSSRASRVRS